MKRLRIGTRASALARYQALTVEQAFRQRYPAIAVELIELSTAGDEQPGAPLERLEGIGWFTSTLERALTEGRIDLAVHSYKDLPVEGEARLEVAATLPRAPVEDVLCSCRGADLQSLPVGARVGTSSLRRLAQLRRLRPDLSFLSLRGNVPTRLERVRCGDLEAVVLARAGLERLGLSDRISEVFSPARMLPAPGQGALAIQTRVGDPTVRELAAALDHAPSHQAVRAERYVLRALRGGCSVPVGACAQLLEPGRFRLRAGVFDLSGSASVEVELEGPDPVALGEAAATRLLEGGAREILERVRVALPRQAVTP